MKQEMIFRDDDIAFRYFIPSENRWLEPEYILKRFKEIDSLFIKYDVKHTISVVAIDFNKAKELIRYIKSHPHIDVQLHGLIHIDYTLFDEFELDAHFIKSKDVLYRIFKKEPIIFYPPWNKTNETVNEVAEEFGLSVSNKKISLQQYIKGNRGERVINFHYWSDECNDLEEALKIHNNENRIDGGSSYPI